MFFVDCREKPPRVPDLCSGAICLNPLRLTFSDPLFHVDFRTRIYDFGVGRHSDTRDWALLELPVRVERARGMYPSRICPFCFLEMDLSRLLIGHALYEYLGASSARYAPVP